MGISDVASSPLRANTGAAKGAGPHRQAALERQLRDGNISPAGLAEYYQLRSNHGTRAAGLARKDVELRAHGKSLDAGEAAELLHLQAGIDPNHARLGAQFAKTGSLPVQSAFSYLNTVNGAQPQRVSEKIALKLLQEHLRQSKSGAKDAKAPRWENLTLNEVELLEQKSVTDAMTAVNEGLAAVAAMPRSGAVHNLRGDERPANAPGPMPRSGAIQSLRGDERPANASDPESPATKEPRPWTARSREGAPLALPQTARIFRP